MALDQVHGYGRRPRYSSPARRRRLRVGMVVGFFLGFVALAWAWAFHRGPDAVGGDVPVLAADPLPTREKPTDPGGMKVADIDPLMYDSGRSPPRIENILPAPEKPLPPPAPRPAPPPQAAAPAPAAAPPSGAVTASSARTPAPMSQAMAMPSTPPQTRTKAQPAARATAPTDEDADDDTDAKPAPARLARLQPPKAKPAVLREEAKPTKLEEKPARVVPGNYRLQLASFHSAAEARASEAKLRGHLGSVLGSVGFSVVTVELPGRGTYYRVMAGPMSQGSASHLCETLRAHGAACLLAR